MNQGLFITLEGIEGAGKSTAAIYLAKYLKQAQIDFILTREPGGTEIAERIRGVILDHYQEQMHPDTEMLLYFAGRAQHLNQVIIPALALGKWVVCDRFTDATYAYQSGGRGVLANKVIELEAWVQGSLQPDLTLLFDVPVEVSVARLASARTPDKFERESPDFFTKIRNAYLDRARNNPKRFCIINSNQALEDVKAEVKNVISSL